VLSTFFASAFHHISLLYVIGIVPVFRAVIRWSLYLSNSGDGRVRRPVKWRFQSSTSREWAGLQNRLGGWLHDSFRLLAVAATLAHVRSTPLRQELPIVAAEQRHCAGRQSRQLIAFRTW
jgi:hypothetical protein